MKASVNCQLDRLYNDLGEDNGRAAGGGGLPITVTMLIDVRSPTVIAGGTIL